EGDGTAARRERERAREQDESERDDGRMRHVAPDSTLAARPRPGHYLPRLARYSGPTRTSRGLAPSPGPMTRSCSIMSMNRAAFGYPSRIRRCRNEIEAWCWPITRCTASQ